MPPSIEDGATVVAATVNSRTLLSCDTIGLPRPQVRWEKNGRAIPQTGARYIMSRSGSLQLNDVQVADSGTYRCIAENSAGTASRDVELLVHGKVTTLPHNLHHIFINCGAPGKFQHLTVTLTQTLSTA